jgi:hypothetical protein
METIKPTKRKWPTVKDGIYKIELGNGTAFDVALYCPNNGSVRVYSIIGKGAFHFSTKVSPEYVAEKLGLVPGDAANMADFINTQTGHELPGPTYGSYHMEEESAPMYPPLVHQVSGPIKALSREEYLGLFDPDCLKGLLAHEKKPDVIAMVCFENIQLDSSECGNRTSVIIGNTFTWNMGSIVTARLGDVPSRFRYPKYIYYIGDKQ